jgi:hypothetical protein
MIFFLSCFVYACGAEISNCGSQDFTLMASKQKSSLNT